MSVDFWADFGRRSFFKTHEHQIEVTQLQLPILSTLACAKCKVPTMQSVGTLHKPNVKFEYQ